MGLAGGLPHPYSVLTSSGGHQITCGWQQGGTHPTGMLSCLFFKQIMHNTKHAFCRPYENFYFGGVQNF